jgi:hypothetical protein
MIKRGKLLRNIIPDDEMLKRSPKYYGAGSEIEITPLGFYAPFSTPLAGWIYKNIKSKEVNKDLEIGIDYILI